MYAIASLTMQENKKGMRYYDHGIQLHETLRIDNNVEVGDFVSIGAFCDVGDSARIGSYAKIRNHCRLDATAKIGEYCDIAEYTDIGNNVSILPRSYIMPHSNFLRDQFYAQGDHFIIYDAGMGSVGVNLDAYRLEFWLHYYDTIAQRNEWPEARRFQLKQYLDFMQVIGLQRETSGRG